VGQAFDAVVVVSHSLALTAGRPLAEVFTHILDHAVARVVRWWG
jgi:hypothetical protein